MLDHRQREKSAVVTATIRLAFLGLVLLLQIAVAAIFSYYLQSISGILMFIFYIVSVIAGIYVYSHHNNPSTRLFWLLLIILFPAFGIIIYLMWGLPRRGGHKHYIDNLSRQAAAEALSAYSADYKNTFSDKDLDIYQEQPALYNISCYLRNFGFPVFANTKVSYFSCGEDLFDDCLVAMKGAKKSIYLSFFIMREGTLWNKFHAILAEKAKQGVEIRLLLDDAGTMFNLSDKFIADLNQEGMQVALFNPTHRYVNSLYLNYRSHQKIIVIDLNIGYTGGVNLSDEYANYTSPFGYWKDTGIRLDGQGVYGLTVAFLDSWDQTVGRLSQSYLHYCPTTRADEEGFCQVVSDGPFNSPHNPAEGLIYRMIESAHHYVYLTTPYLAVSQSLIDTICRTAQSGVRVVLLVPYIADHWYVFEVTQSHFAELIAAGVEVYRFTPGMLHAKMIVADDMHALVGTINLDNRSFYSQYEDGVWFCGKKAVADVKNDIENTLEISYRVTMEDCQKIGLFRSFFALLLRVFSPLM